MTRAVCLGVLATFVWTAWGGSLASAEDADTLIRKGVELRRQGKEQEALETFQRAVQIKRAPRALAQVALAEQAMGTWVTAERDLKEALAGEATDAWIAKNRRQLEDALRVIQGHLGSLEVVGEPVGAEVLADGEPIGLLPLARPLRLPIGEITLTVRKEGYDKITRVASIARGALVRESVTLHRAPVAPVAIRRAPPPRVDGPESTTPAGGGRPVRMTLKAAPPPEEATAASSPIYGRWWFWTAIGVVAVGAGAGAYLLTRPHCTKTACNELPRS
ncbi:MAG TPA: tetratricopeptide repeat protein [Polyangia bacterium]|jgi:hypothetical protein|nr:tetratricopeptide repeat protein [Polyangia bacterium]